MKKLRNLLVVGMLLAAAALGGWGSKDLGTPPEVLLDGTKVVVGQTKPSDLAGENWELADLGK